jgi:hypothetical protein
MRCKIEVVGTTTPRAGVSIWCDTCCENVAWKESFTEAEVVATAAGHREVMKRAREMNRGN